MNVAIPKIRIPNRFESILESPYFQAKSLTSLILPVSEDLDAFSRLRRRADLQQGGLLVFLLGPSGIGKTTAVYSSSIHMANYFSEVFPIPADVDLREIFSWIKDNLPSPGEKTRLVLFDGREVTDDLVGVRQFLSSLNQLLRKRKDILFIWPITDSSWHTQIREIAEGIGGTNLAPSDSDVQIIGPAKDLWINSLEQLLMQLDVATSELGLDQGILTEILEKCKTIGEFLGEVGIEIIRRVDDIRKYQDLPSIIFIITSGREVVGEADRIRSAGTYRLKAQELLAYSPKSKSGKWWNARRKAGTKFDLGYVITLFHGSLATMTPSAVVYSCLYYGDTGLQSVVRAYGINKHKGNAKAALRATDLYKFLMGQTSRELTSGRKGTTRTEIKQAYDAIQKLSSKHHKRINTAICKMLADNIDGFDYKSIKYEVDAGDQNLYTDAIAKINDNEYYLEFHHLSEGKCKAASMSSYTNGKLSDYAIHHNLAER